MGELSSNALDPHTALRAHAEKGARGFARRTDRARTSYGSMRMHTVSGHAVYSGQSRVQPTIREIIKAQHHWHFETWH